MEIDAGCFAVSDAIKAGMSRGELRSRRYESPIPGVRALAGTTATTSWSDVVRDAHAAAAGDDQFFSHTTAARLHGMPLPSRFDDEGFAHVASPELGNRSRKTAAVGHRIRAETTTVGPYRVECIADTIVHLASLLTERELVPVVDWALSRRRERPLTKLTLTERLQYFKGARGIPRLRRAIAAAREGSESPMESESRLLVVDAGFPDPRLNIDVHDEQGRFVARLDMAWPNLRIALEYDGDHHRTDAAQHAHDTVRIERLHLLGWIVIRVTKEHMRDPRRLVLPRLREAFARRGVRVP